MIYRIYTPKPPLAEYIESFWFYQDQVNVSTLERVLPNGRVGLVINLQKDLFRVYDRHNHHNFQTFSGCLITGTRSEFSVIDTEQQAVTIGVAFKPGGAYPFLKLPLNQVHNYDLNLTDLWGLSGSELHEQILEAATIEAKFAVLEKILLAQLAQFNGGHPAVTYALKHFQKVPHQQTIAAVTAQIGLSQKRFSQIFNEQVGLTPKMYCRIQRFQAVLGLLENGQNIKWIEVALSCGYFDQAHFIHDFKAFSGVNPEFYLNQRGVHRNHLPIFD